MVGWQFFYDFEAFGVSAKTIERKRVSHSAIDFVWRPVVSLFCEVLRFFCVLPDVESESGEICCDRRLVRRAFVQALENVIKFSSLILCAIESRQRVERFTPHRRILCNTQPKLFGFYSKVPFRSQTRECKSGLWSFVCRLLGRAPQCFGFSVGGML